MNKNKQYYNTLDRQLYEKIQGKMVVDQLKKRDMIEMKEREKELEIAKNLEHEQRNKYLAYMNNTYKTTLEYKKDKERGQKEADLEDEKEQLKRIQRDLKEEQKRNEKKKATFMHEVYEVENHTKMMKENERKVKDGMYLILPI
jgi:hypothetical protein